MYDFNLFLQEEYKGPGKCYIFEEKNCLTDCMIFMNDQKSNRNTTLSCQENISVFTKEKKDKLRQRIFGQINNFPTVYKFKLFFNYVFKIETSLLTQQPTFFRCLLINYSSCPGFESGLSPGLRSGRVFLKETTDWEKTDSSTPKTRQKT